MAQKILIIDDDEGVLSALSLLLKSEGYMPVTVDSPERAMAVLHGEDFDSILMDLNYSLDTTSGEEGLKLIAAIRQLDDLIPIVVMTGWRTIDVAVSTMKKGANDFIQKPWENDRLLTIIENQTKLANIQRQSEKLSQQNMLLLEEASPAQNVVAESKAIKRVLETISQVAKSDVSVLLTGENGTGKSMLARYLHDISLRKNSPFVSVNMGAVTESLFESEMFGHVKGAFTDAKSTRIGRFEMADEGTLFLDEIANTPYSRQGKLLRVLEDGQFEKVGSSKTQTVNIRLITATNTDLSSAVKEGRFREDFLYRINTVEIEVPPLRDRVQDIVPLAYTFLTRAARKYSQQVLSIDATAESALKSYHWPGNVRELSHVMERAQILCQQSTIRRGDLGLNIVEVNEQEAERGSGPEYDLRPLDEIEMDVIDKRLSHFEGDASRAARSLGLSRSAFYRRLGKSKD